MSKVIYRLTESELKRLVSESVRKVIKEQDTNFLLQVIAQAVSDKGRIDAEEGEQDIEIPVGDNKLVYILFKVNSNPYEKPNTAQPMDEPNNEIVDKPSVDVIDIEIMKDGENYPLEDNGIVARAIESVMVMDYTNQDIPSEGDFFSEY